jgi:hypothetical protein
MNPANLAYVVEHWGPYNSSLLAGFGGDTAVAKGQKFNVVDTSGLTDADWAVIDRVNRACELGGAAAFWDELEKLDNVSLQLRVVGAFSPELIREVIEEEMTEHGLTVEDLREMLKRVESPTRDLCCQMSRYGADGPARSSPTTATYGSDLGAACPVMQETRRR